MKSLRLWLGALLVALGVLWLLDVAGMVRAGAVIVRWWPLALIVLGLLAIINERRLVPGPVVVLLVGVALLLSEFTRDGLGQLLWPILAVVIGGWLLLDRVRRRVVRSSSGEHQDVIALLGGSRVSNRSSSFAHADVSALLGGATLDLRDATPAPGAVVDALAVFGGVEVIVPRDWRIELSGFPIFGGFHDKTTGQRNGADDAPVLRVVGVAIFGGVEVKNPTHEITVAGVPAAGSVGPDLR